MHDACLFKGKIMKKNDIWQGVCDGYTYDGEGVVRLDGIVFFVKGLLEGEEAELGITAMKKNYGYARIVKLLKESSHRVKPACSSYRLCGGCQLMHMDYETQKQFKRDKVKNLFLQNAHLDVDVNPVLTDEEHLRAYRNKVQVPVQFNNGKTEMGFYQNHTNRIIEYDRCCVQTDLSNDIVRSMKGWLQNLGCTSSFRHVLIKHAHRTGQVMVCMIVREYPFRNSEVLVQKLKDAYPQIRSIQCIVNRREDNVILDGREIQIFGDGYIEETLLGRTFRISARSFYQINPYATELLYSKALEYADIKSGDTVIDLYCGTGTIGILASAKAGRVFGIEIVDDAVKDARINAQINHADNIEFFTADAQQGAARLIKNKIHADVVIVDPPRKGCSKQTLDAVITMSPDRLVYVSCDPATLTRDCAYLEENGYKVGIVQPVDLFPDTLHIETIVLLQKLNS